MPPSHLPALLLMAASLSSAPAHGAPPSASLAADRVIGVLQARAVAGEVAIADLNGKVEDRVTGLADREGKKPHRVGQIWLWASVSKQVAATFVLQEVGRGRMALDAPVGAYLKAFSGNRTLTIKSLLQHQSDLPNPDESPANGEGVPAFYLGGIKDTADRQAAGGYCAGQVVPNPDRQFRYNNCDYLVLGAALEQVTGQDFARLVATRLNRDLGLKSVSVAGPAAVHGTEVRGYDGEKPYPLVNVATFGAAGAMRGSAADLVRFDLKLLDGTMLKAQQRTLAWSGDPALGYQGLGVWAFPAELKGCAKPVDLVERRGEVGGVQVRNIIAPELGRAVAVFTNDATVDFGEIWQGQGLTFDLLSAALCEGVAA